jgi:hypothetical protein
MIAIVIQSVSVLTGAALWGDAELRLYIMMICGPFVLFSISIASWRTIRR